jgi:hypothetical protein
MGMLNDKPYGTGNENPKADCNSRDEGDPGFGVQRLRLLVFTIPLASLQDRLLKGLI